MTLVTTRLALHRLAEQVIAPLRVQETGNEIALQPRPGGFGTPDLPGGGWVGVSGTDVVNAAGERQPISSLRAAAAFVGLRSDGLADEALAVDPADAQRLAEAWARAEQDLSRLAAGASSADAPSEINLWPEHFDIAIELGPEAARATYGVSPGDDEHSEPYAYVAPWTPPPEDPFWNATGFTGAQTADLGRALDLWRDARSRLA